MNLGIPTATGNTAKIYLYENKIYKVFNDSLPAGESMKEAKKQQYAHSCGLPVPEIYDVTNIDGKQVIIMEHIEGRATGDLLTDNMEKAEYYMGMSVDIQMGIHQIKAHSIEPMSEKLRRQIQSAPELDHGVKSVLIKQLDSMTFVENLCHGDFHLYNLILSENNVAIIDWVDSSAGDKRADVYRTYLLYSQVSKELADLYMRLYCEKSGLTKEEVFQWAPIIAAARLSERVSSEDPMRLLEIVHEI
ncbi:MULTISPECIES: aminoglycoside phosphotransferase family protein [Rossellomorea]|uniref:phosphotransferase family protein n=1 Tax=Rossellomorea TaxID=2837508 RepID=UPI001CCE4E7D|nr:MULTISPECIES: aminoglycoside phosphotransferase family protein [Rossellomorea]MCA0149546.1 aminoglycoside phosphotransferase family protein [Rossellomorea vietnamensis]WGG46653.1 aminoglycoside phosphotransferase family protein [Rossellomorea sp. DA94]